MDRFQSHHLSVIRLSENINLALFTLFNNFNEIEVTITQRKADKIKRTTTQRPAVDCLLKAKYDILRNPKSSINVINFQC